MSLFASIWEKLTGHARAAAPTTASTTAPPTADSPAPPPQSAQPEVDVTAILDGLARESRQRLDWRHSIVDLLKLLELDSSLTARRSLASELGYAGDAGDSAAMNMWLHAQVLRKLKDNGGKVPEDLQLS